MAERQKPTIRNGNNFLEDDVLWYCGYNDHTILKKGYVNNTRQEHFSNKKRNISDQISLFHEMFHMSTSLLIAVFLLSSLLLPATSQA